MTKCAKGKPVWLHKKNSEMSRRRERNYAVETSIQKGKWTLPLQLASCEESEITQLRMVTIVVVESRDCSSSPHSLLSKTLVLFCDSPSKALRQSNLTARREVARHATRRLLCKKKWYNQVT